MTFQDAGRGPADHDIDSAHSLHVVANKHRKRAPETCVPDRLKRVQSERLQAAAAEAFQRMTRAARADGVHIVPVSGYRSYAEQASLYDSCVRQYGQETADTIAVRPGRSSWPSCRRTPRRRAPPSWTPPRSTSDRGPPRTTRRLTPSDAPGESPPGSPPRAAAAGTMCATPSAPPIGAPQ